VVTDLAGFVAASYARGIALVHAPTSLLGMADAAIGGKTGINLPEGKNLVGAFWQPNAVLMDVTTLRTLPPAVFTAGAVEVFKHGLLADPDLAEAVVDGRLSQGASDAELVHWLAASARVKADVVARDVSETAGARATLNLGHTVAHALEAISAHAIDHGGAVAWGLLYAAHLSRLDALRHGRAYEDWSDPCRRLIRLVRPPTPATQRFGDLLPFLARDKKNRAGRRRWVLADAPGRARLTGDVAEEDERAAWQAFREDVRTLAADVGEGASLRREGGDA
jgi:3-dehydroquinate synthase